MPASSSAVTPKRVGTRLQVRYEYDTKMRAASQPPPRFGRVLDGRVIPNAAPIGCLDHLGSIVLGRALPLRPQCPQLTRRSQLKRLPFETRNLLVDDHPAPSGRPEDHRRATAPTSGSLSGPAQTSTRGMSCGGYQKWAATTRSRCVTFDTSSLAGCPLPEAKIAGGAQTSSSRPYTSSCTLRSAGTASRTSSHPPRPRFDRGADATEGGAHFAGRDQPLHSKAALLAILFVAAARLSSRRPSCDPVARNCKSLGHSVAHEAIADDRNGIERCRDCHRTLLRMRFPPHRGRSIAWSIHGSMWTPRLDASASFGRIQLAPIVPSLPRPGREAMPASRSASGGPRGSGLSSGGHLRRHESGRLVPYHLRGWSLLTDTDHDTSSVTNMPPGGSLRRPWTGQFRVSRMAVAVDRPRIQHLSRRPHHGPFAQLVTICQ